MPTSAPGEGGETESRYEKVNYPNDDKAPMAGERQQGQRQYGDRQGYQQRPYGYQNRQGG